MNEFELLSEKLKEIADLHAAASLMSWDQEVMMPAGGAGMRARQIATIHGLSHHKITDEAAPLLEKALAAGPADDFQERNLKEIKRGLERSTKLPNEHIKAMSRLTSQALGAWVEARKKSDFSIFQPFLEKIVDLKLKETEYLGYEENPYDALVDEYEPGMRASRLEAIFTPFKERLSGLLARIREAEQVEDSFLDQPIDKESQLAFGKEAVTRLGYDIHHGRQDLSAHPFSIGINPQDVRITTMVKETDIREMLYSSIHEAGHAMYEQGLPLEHYGLPAGEYCSLSIHESQSRLWENNVGRGQAFIQHFFPQMRELFPDKLAGKSADDLFRAVNRVEPGLIRISSDELTYHFHVILRFEIEKALINREVKVAELPELWNAKVKSYLGLDVPNDAQGVLQDIHWSHGSIGYFPTYSLGSFYAAQFMHFARVANPGLETGFAQGDFNALKSWLNKEIHAKGRLYNSEELCTLVTGEPLNVSYFIDYAWEKFGRVYGISRD